MSHTSQMTRYRPAVLAITGIAAVYGAYVLYTTYTREAEAAKIPSRNAGLRRRGAVHRPRAERLDVKIEVLDPDDECVLGRLKVLVGSTSVTYAVTLDASYPTLAEVERDIGVPIDTTNLEGLLRFSIILSILKGTFLTWDQDHVDSFPVPELAPLAEILATRDLTIILQQGPQLLEEKLSHAPGRSDIGAAFWSFLHGPVFNSGRRQESSEHATHADTDDASGIDALNDMPDEPSQGLKGLLYHIAQAEANRKAYEHRGIHCDECGETPIRGVRWHCMNCPDWDLCSACEANTNHQSNHIFVKIRVPFPVLSRLPRSQPSWYTGDPREFHHELDPDVRKRMCNDYGFESPKIDALFEQFCCLVNVRNGDERRRFEFGIDRAGFDKACYPGDTSNSRWRPLFRPNDVYDRVFAFYDVNNDGMIDFEEFVSGMSYLRGPDRYQPLSRALQGFDIDRDGFVDRYDFIRLFRAKHNIQRLLVESMIEAQEAQYTQEGMERLRSSQPISSIFAEEEIPPGERRPRTGKALDRYGDMQPQHDTKTILDDNEGWPSVHERRQARAEARRPTHERLQNQLANVDGMLESDTENRTHPRVIGPHGGYVPTLGMSQSPLGEGVSGPFASRDTEDEVVEDEELDQNVIWEIVEQGFHEMLDPLFQKKEQADGEVVSNRALGEKWKKEVDEVATEMDHKENVKRELQNGARTDPLIATAMNAYERPLRSATKEPNGTIELRQGMVATDSESLTRREAEISQRPLEELLNVSGYGIVDEAASPDHVMNEDIRTSEAQFTESAASGGDEPRPDPTMPQNRPNGPNPWSIPEDYETASAHTCTESSPSAQKIVERPPPQKTLELLVRYRQLDKEIKARGGVGRLSYDEVEQLVQADMTRELRGLVISWLEWASF